MNIAIIGSTGMVGAAVVAEATQRGHEVTGYSRSGTKGTTLDFSNTAAVTEAIAQRDVTIITAVIRDEDGSGYQTIKRAHKDLIAAAPAGRLIVVGGAGALTLEDGTELRNLPGFPADYKPEADTFAEILADYRASSLDWTVVAPSPEIAPGARTGEYVTALDTPAGDFVSVEDFAIALVDEVENAQHAGKRFTVASKDAAAAQG